MLLNIKKILIIILSISIISLLFLIKIKDNTKQENFTINKKRILDLYTFIGCTKSKDKKLNENMKEILTNNENFNANLEYIMDGTFIVFPNLEKVQLKNRNIKYLHNKTFYKNTKLKEVDFTGCPIETIGSNIFNDNIGNKLNGIFKISKLNDNQKINIILYEQTFNDLKNSNTINLGDTYDNISDIYEKDKLLFDWFQNDLKNMKTIHKSKFKELILQCLGVDKSHIETFKLKNGETDLQPDDFVSMFNIVYYKDTLFTTDLARWRCKYIQNEETADIIVKNICLSPSNINKPHYESIFEYFKEMCFRDNLNKLQRIRYDIKIVQPIDIKLMYTKINNFFNNFKIYSERDIKDIDDIQLKNKIYICNKYKHIIYKFKNDYKNKCDDNADCFKKLSLDINGEYDVEFTNEHDNLKLNTPDIYDCDSKAKYSLSECTPVRLKFNQNNITYTVPICRDYIISNDWFYEDYIISEHNRFDKLNIMLTKFPLIQVIEDYISNAEKFLDNEVQISKIPGVIDYEPN